MHRAASLLSEAMNQSSCSSLNSEPEIIVKAIEALFIKI
jgi:hypothetical protein